MSVVQTPNADEARAQRWLTAGFAGETRVITDPTLEVPLLLRIAAASQRLRDAQAALADARVAWKAFSARHGDDDPGHEQHHRTNEQALRLVRDLDLDVARLLREVGQSIELHRVEIGS